MTTDTTEPEWLPTFPVDDAMLDSIEHALGGTLTLERPEDADPDDDGPWLIGADYSLHQLLDFIAGHDEENLIHLGDSGGIPTYEYPFPLYHPNDVIRALITEVRRLRTPETPAST